MIEVTTHNMPPSITDSLQSGDSVANEKVREDTTLIFTGNKERSRKGKNLEEDEPLIDTTANLTLRSKKTQRTQRKLQRKEAIATQRTNATLQLFDLPSELLHEIFDHLPPSDLFRCSAVSRAARDFINEHESTLAHEVIRQRYWVLSQCFILPVALQDVEPSAHSALLNRRWQDMLQIHRKPYEHIKGIDSHKVCSCPTCVWAWNYLNLILDLSYWQKNLDEREPLPTIERGTNPDWNVRLLNAHAAVVERAMKHPLTYARILEKHLATTVGTIMRTVRKKHTVHPKRLYHLTPADSNTETDEFLERSGPPSHEPPWRRDSYHYLEAFVPNRIWANDKNSWIYYAKASHAKDLLWMKERFASQTSASTVV